MIAVPFSDTEVIVLDDGDPDRWFVHVVDYAARSFESFEVDGVGAATSAHYDRVHGILWVVVEGGIFTIKRSDQDIYEAPMPDEPFFVYALTGEGDGLYVAGEYSNLWYLRFDGLTWTPLLRPAPKPPEASDPEVQSRQVSAYAGEHPPFYAGFPVGDAHVFCGALGTVARVRGGTVERTEIETAARLVAGQEEDGRIVLSADSPAAEIYKGDLDEGFTLLFADPQPAMNRTAKARGTRFLGIAIYPPCDLHNLYTLADGEVAEHMTDCAREPFALTALVSTGAVVWAVDEAGIFRWADGAWTLLDHDDIDRGAFPEA